MQNYTEQIKILIQPFIEAEKDCFLVAIEEKPANNFFIYCDTDQGITLSTLTRIHRQLYKVLEEQLFAPGNFSIELSSPSLDKPLLLHRQYIKNKSRYVCVHTLDQQKIEGTLKDLTETHLILEIKDKKGVQEKVLPFQQIEKTVVIPKL